MFVPVVAVCRAWHSALVPRTSDRAIPRALRQNRQSTLRQRVGRAVAQTPTTDVYGWWLICGAVGGGGIPMPIEFGPQAFDNRLVLGGRLAPVGGS